MKRNILIVDSSMELENALRAPLTKQLDQVGISALLVRAKDGADAAMKSENQKFDMVLIDTEVPRLMEGGFVYGIHSYKNTQSADILVISQKDPSELPDTLRSSRFFKKPVNPTEIIDAMISIFNSQNQGADSPKDSAPTPTAAAEAKYAVDVRVINSVIKATTSVLGQFGVNDVTMGKAGRKSPQEPLLGDISSVIDIKSQSFQGHLVISFDKASYLEVVSTMLMEEQTELTPDNQDAVGEINNIIFGNSKAELTNYGVQMTTPKVLIGANQNLNCPVGSAGMMIPFKTSKGHFYLFVVALPVAGSAAA